MAIPNLKYYMGVYDSASDASPSDFFEILTFNQGQKIKLVKNKIPWHNNAGLYMVFNAIKREGYLTFVKPSDKFTHRFSEAAIEDKVIPKVAIFAGYNNIRTSNVYRGEVLENSFVWTQAFIFFEVSVIYVWLRYTDGPFKEADFVTIDIVGFDSRVLKS